MGVSSDTGSWAIFNISRTLSTGIFIWADISSGEGSCPSLLQKLTGNTDDLVDGLHHVHGDADGAGLVGDGSGDGLTDPPGGVGGELIALSVVKFFHPP